ncbi:MAG: stage II sporulation protein D [Clostridioides sp.]|jgi:stage II sporulation protein D|nr:stage II sporulation protein D [Clostridioides sp.]
MKNPIVVLACILLCAIIAPIALTNLSYRGDNSTVSENSRDSVGVNLEDADKGKDKQEIESVDGESPIIDMYNHKLGKYQKISLEDYLAGVLAGEMSPEFNDEALKAQAVAARTYVVYKLDRQFPKKHNKSAVCTDFKHCQEYKSASELTKTNGKKWMDEKYSKIVKAVGDTKGQVIQYEGKAILPLYFSTSSGKTEDSKEVFAASYPYLKSVDSPYDSISPKFTSKARVSNSDFVACVKKWNKKTVIGEKNLAVQVKITKRSQAGTVESVKIGNKTFKGTDIRTMFALNSANFDISFEGGKVVFNVKGYGHGVGMSQWGAEGMAENGYKYADIISHYYLNTKIVDTY